MRIIILLVIIGAIMGVIAALAPVIKYWWGKLSGPRQKIVYKSQRMVQQSGISFPPQTKQNKKASSNTTPTPSKSATHHAPHTPLSLPDPQPTPVRAKKPPPTLEETLRPRRRPQPKEPVVDTDTDVQEDGGPSADAS